MDDYDTAYLNDADTEALFTKTIPLSKSAARAAMSRARRASPNRVTVARKYYVTYTQHTDEFEVSDAPPPKASRKTKAEASQERMLDLQAENERLAEMLVSSRMLYEARFRDLTAALTYLQAHIVKQRDASSFRWPQTLCTNSSGVLTLRTREEMVLSEEQP